jgi:hypothetical protein
MIFAKGAALLLLVLAIAGAQARAQNQTPANVAFVGWTDPATGLSWTREDNGSDVNWNHAITYCTNLRLGGYSDWRLPTIDELQGIFDIDIANQGHWPNGNTVTWHVKGNLKLSGAHWSSNQKDAKEAWCISFSHGQKYYIDSNDSYSLRALCVRR